MRECSLVDVRQPIDSKGTNEFDVDYFPIEDPRLISSPFFCTLGELLNSNIMHFKTIVILVTCVIASFLLGVLSTKDYERSSEDNSTNITAIEDPRASRTARPRERVNEAEKSKALVSQGYEETYTLVRDNVFFHLEEGRFENAYDELQSNQGVLDPDDYKLFRNSVYHAWAKADPEALLTLLSENGTEPVSEDVLLTIAESYGAQDAKKAFEWLRTAEEEGLISSDKTLTSCYVAIMRKYAEENPEFVAKVLQNTVSQELQLSLIAPLVTQFSASNSTGIVEWLAAFESDAVRKKGISTLLAASTQPREVIDKIIENQNLLPRYSVSQAFQKLASLDPQAAAATLDTLDEKNRSKLVHQFITGWMSKDAEAAESWLSNLGGGSIYDASSEAVSKRMAYSDPRNAIGRASTIGDKNIRKQSILNTINTTNESNLPELGQYIKDLNAPKADEEAYLKSIAQRISNEHVNLMIPE